MFKLRGRLPVIGVLIFFNVSREPTIVGRPTADIFRRLVLEWRRCCFIHHRHDTAVLCPALVREGIALIINKSYTWPMEMKCLPHQIHRRLLQMESATNKTNAAGSATCYRRSPSAEDPRGRRGSKLSSSTTFTASFIV